MSKSVWMKISCNCLLGLSLLVVTGCNNSEEYREVSDSDLQPVADDHHHAHAAPHGGLLVELGEHEYNAELVFADAEPMLTVYILGPHAETSAAAKADSLSLTAGEQALSLKPMPQEGDAEGMASQFQLDGPLPEAIDQASIHGDLKVTIGETEYAAHVHGSGDHDDHDHDHDHDHDEHTDHDHDHADHDHAEHKETEEAPKTEEAAK